MRGSAWWGVAAAWVTIGSAGAALAAGPGEIAAGLDSASTSGAGERGGPAAVETAAGWRAYGGLADDLGALPASPSAPSDTAGLAVAYERLQELRSRVPADPVAAEGGAPVAADPMRWTAARVQRELLREGDLLLEWATGLERSYLFALTRREMRLFTLGGVEDLTSRIATGRAILSSPPRERDATAAAREAADTLAAAVLGGALPFVTRARAVIIVPDGPLLLVPFAALAARSGAPAASRTFAIAPSVAMLAGARRADPPPAKIRLLAVATHAEPRAAGAEREVKWLAATFEGIEQPAPGGRDLYRFVSTLSGYEALHFAGGTRLYEDAPGRSGIDVGAFTADSSAAAGSPAATDDPRAASLLMRTRVIATSALRARLVVLSSCETLPDRFSSSRAATALTTALMGAGARSIVVPLWPLEDRATESLIRELYRALESGLPVGPALKLAQERVRRSRGTQHPYYWAGFALFGDPAAEVPLKPLPLWRRAAKGGRPIR